MKKFCPQIVYTIAMMFYKKEFLYWGVVTTSLLFYLFYFLLRRELQLFIPHPPENSVEKYTIRVNTFRRNDLLESFLAHYSTCPEVNSIQVVWSDQQYNPPKHLVDLYPPTKVEFEKHSSDRLSNRFKPTDAIKTRAVLSIDDDLLISCQQLRLGFNIWTANENALVGYAPRMHAINPVSGEDRYLRWQDTWWNGMYSIVLTKAAFLHKKYLREFFKILPESFVADIDRNRNCEDIAMSYVVGSVSRAPPVWVEAVVHETADFGISTGASHFDDRSKCLTKLRQVSKNMSTVTYLSQIDSLPLEAGYQKARPMSALLDWIRLSNGGSK